MLDEETQQPEGLNESEEAAEEITENSESGDSVGTQANEEVAEESSPGRQRRERAAARGGSRGDVVLEAPTEPPPPPRLYQQFKDEIIPTMVREFNYNNPMEVPRLQKIVLNIGVGEALTNGRAIESATRDLTVISGQKPVVTLSLIHI